ncbi:MAG: tRNA pseudouridine(38-40) synthase TruA [Candidatus Cloacimonetes bacterium]|nr:tRNA pseudouridine(38-40) synthase TruA [Candidatus Cloacimonadota bacterium]
MIIPKKRYLLDLSYDGTFFHGWQIQNETRTVQETLELAISEIHKRKIKVTGAGRTDTKVHALHQFAHVDLELNMTTSQLTKAINSKLPKDVRVNSVTQVHPDFHARYSAIERSYMYLFSDKYDLFSRFHKSYIPHKNFDLEIMKECFAYLLGKHDFTSLSKFNPDLNNQICEITSIDLIKKDDDYIFSISSNRFLHNMIRRIVGTIINISYFQEDPLILEEIILKKNPSHKMIFTAPPNGLYLSDVKYKNYKF